MKEGGQKGADVKDRSQQWGISARTVLGVVLVVGAVAQLAILGVARAVQLALAQPHGEFCTARHHGAPGH